MRPWPCRQRKSWRCEGRNWGWPAGCGLNRWSIKYCSRPTMPGKAQPLLKKNARLFSVGNKPMTVKSDSLRGKYVIAGIGHTAFGKLGQDTVSLNVAACASALADAGVEKEAV